MIALADARKVVTDRDLLQIVQDARAEVFAARAGGDTLVAHGYGHGV
jgi:hypothetical protein